jgi:hypothetical protein
LAKFRVAEAARTFADHLGITPIRAPEVKYPYTINSHVYIFDSIGSGPITISVNSSLVD